MLSWWEIGPLHVQCILGAVTGGANLNSWVLPWCGDLYMCISGMLHFRQPLNVYSIKNSKHHIPTIMTDGGWIDGSRNSERDRFLQSAFHLCSIVEDKLLFSPLKSKIPSPSSQSQVLEHIQTYLKANRQHTTFQEHFRLPSSVTDIPIL